MSREGLCKMLDFLCDLVEKIVFSGINGKILIIPLVIALKVLIGQVIKEWKFLKEV